MNTIIVTGGAGYIGSHICKQLAKSGMTPVTLDSLAHGHESLVKWGPLEVGDISDVDWVRNQIKRHAPTAVIHCAAYASATESLVQPAMYYCNNVIGTLSLLNAMIAENVRQLVFCGSSAIYGQPDFAPVREEDPCRPATPYARSLWMIEQIIADYADAYSMRHVILRTFEAAGADPETEAGEMRKPETHLIPQAVRAALEHTPLKIYGTDFPTPDGTAVRDYIHVTDLAEIHLKALHYLQEGGQACVLNAGSGVGASARDVVEAVEYAIGTRLEIESAPGHSSEPTELVADVSRLSALLHFTPSHSTLNMMVETACKWQMSLRAPAGA